MVTVHVSCLGRVFDLAFADGSQVSHLKYQLITDVTSPLNGQTNDYTQVRVTYLADTDAPLGDAVALIEGMKYYAALPSQPMNIPPGNQPHAQQAPAATLSVTVVWGDRAETVFQLATGSKIVDLKDEISRSGQAGYQDKTAAYLRIVKTGGGSTDDADLLVDQARYWAFVRIRPNEDDDDIFTLEQ